MVGLLLVMATGGALPAEETPGKMLATDGCGVIRRPDPRVQDRQETLAPVVDDRTVVTERGKEPNAPCRSSDPRMELFIFLLHILRSPK